MRHTSVRGLGTAVAAAVAVVCTAAGCGSASPPATAHEARATGRTTPSGSPSPSAPAPAVAAAQVESRRLLATVTVPPGSTSVAAAPTQRLRQPAEEPDSGNLVDAAAWWTIPLRPVAAMAWLRAHRPPGLTVIETSSGNDGDLSVVDQGAPGQAYQAPDLSLLVVPLGAHASALRADAQVVWYPDTTTAERAPTGAGTTATVAYRRRRRGSPWVQRTLTGAAAQQLAVAFNALPAQPPATYSCRDSDGLRLRLSFPTGLVATTGSGCADVSVTVTVRGRPQPSLVPSAGLDALVFDALHLPRTLP